MSLILIGAGLILCGVLLVAVRMIRSGPLSRTQQADTTRNPTLEPRGRSAVFNLKEHLPGIGLMGLGIVLLLAAAAA